jgi:hypothetical protein
MWLGAQGGSVKKKTKKQMHRQATRHNLRLKNHGGFSGRDGYQEKAKEES